MSFAYKCRETLSAMGGGIRARDCSTGGEKKVVTVQTVPKEIRDSPDTIIADVVCGVGIRRVELTVRPGSPSGCTTGHISGRARHQLLRI